MIDFLEFFQNYGFPGLIVGVLFIMAFQLQKTIEKTTNKIIEDFSKTCNLLLSVIEQNTIFLMK